MDRPRTLGELRASGYRSISVKDEMRRNLLRRLRTGAPLFPGVLGYEDTVFPQIVNALLARHDLLLLGLRGQAKTRMLRGLVGLLDEALPVVAGSELADDPFHPITRLARELVARHGEATPITWLSREARFHEKLATPDVTVADLIGDVDLIKHAEGRYLSDELTLHYGLIPRSHRGIFCLNELPDLPPRIQVALFNVLEERDVQIRGHPVRLNLDLCLAFSANPEDYTQRGRIVTPLKDRIGSVIRTHYPGTRALGVAIADEAAWTDREDKAIVVPPYLKEVIEEFVRQARTDPRVNTTSGVSVRLSITAREVVASSAEQRALRWGEARAVARVSDLAAILAAARGKVELSLTEEDGEEDAVVASLLTNAVGTVFGEMIDRKRAAALAQGFPHGFAFRTGAGLASMEYAVQLAQLPVLAEVAASLVGSLEKDCAGSLASASEFVLEGLHQQGQLDKQHLPGCDRFAVRGVEEGER